MCEKVFFRTHMRACLRVDAYVPACGLAHVDFVSVVQTRHTHDYVYV